MTNQTNASAPAYVIKAGAGFEQWTQAGLWAFRRAGDSPIALTDVGEFYGHSTKGRVVEARRADTGARVLVNDMALGTVETLPEFPPFDSYVCEGDTVSVDHDGFTFTARIVRDDCTDRPDERDDGFWPSLDPNDAGYIGSNNRAEYERQRERAESIMDGWRNDDWYYVGVVVGVARHGITLDAHAASLWGIEANYPVEGDDVPNAYLGTVANELLGEAVDEARKILALLCDCNSPLAGDAPRA